jgi:hypothetical protein
MNLQELVDLTLELNAELYEVSPKIIEEDFIFSVEIMAENMYGIYFNGCLLWHSVEETREWIEAKDDYEDMRVYLVKLLTAHREMYGAALSVLKSNLHKDI